MTAPARERAGWVGGQGDDQIIPPARSHARAGLVIPGGGVGCWKPLRGIQQMPQSDDPITPGTVWRQVKLGTEAVYEVLSVGEDVVDVTVRRAPGLAPGTRVRLSRAALEEMDPVSGSGADGAP